MHICRPILRLLMFKVGGKKCKRNSTHFPIENIQILNTSQGNWLYTQRLQQKNFYSLDDFHYPYRFCVTFYRTLWTAIYVNSSPPWIRQNRKTLLTIWAGRRTKQQRNQRTSVRDMRSNCISNTICTLQFNNR